MNLKQTKKLLALLLAGTMMTSLVACGDKDDAKDNSDDSSGDTTSSEEENINMDGDIELNEPGKMPIVKEGQDPITLSIFTSPQADNCTEFSRESNAITPWIEDKTNLRFDWTIISKADKTTKLNLLFTSDDYQDIVFGSGWDSLSQLQYGKAGYIIPLNDYYDNGEGVYWEKFVDLGYKENDGSITDAILDSMVMPDGNIYSMYKIPIAFHSKYAFRMWIYEPWLDAVGMKMPTTTDEFYDVLKAFKEKDPNGNGKADEIPLTGALKAYNTDPTNFLMNAFTYYGGAGQTYCSVDDGEVVFTPATDGYRAGLEYMAKLSEEGLLLTDTWTQDVNALRAISTAETQILGCAPGGSIAAFSKIVNGKEGNWTNYKPLPPLKGPDGVQYAAYNPSYGQTSFNITDNCEYPRIAFRFGDVLNDNEVAANLINGMEGEYWVYAEDGDIGLDGEPADYSIIKQPNTGADAVKNYAWSQISNAAQSPGWHTGQTVQVDPSVNIESFLYDAAIAYSEFKPDDDMILAPLVFEDEDTVTQVVDWRTAINDYLVTESILMIKEGVTDEKWDAYIKELKARGLEDMLKVYQETYDKK